MDSLNLWTFLLAIATFLLALIAAASIVVNVLMRSKDLSENRRMRIQKRELEIKDMALNEIKAYTIEFLDLVFISGASIDYSRAQWATRFNCLLFESSAVVNYAGLLSKQLKKKALTLVDCVTDYNKEITSDKRGIQKRDQIFIVDSEKRLKLRDRVIHDVSEVLKALSKEKIKLYTGN